MGIINRYSRRTPYEGSLYQLPVELIASTLEQTQKRFDQNKDIADQIRDFSIPALPQDRERANQLQKQYTTQVDELVKQYSGNYAKASSQLKDLTRKIKRDFTPGGEANAITSNYNNYITWSKESQDLVEKKRALGADFNQANSYYMNEYKGIGEYNPVTGSYNQFRPDTLTDYVDPNEIIKKTFDSMKSEKRKVGRTEFKNGLQVYTETEQEGVTKERLKPAFMSALDSNPAFAQYVAQKAKFAGISSQEAKGYFDRYTSQMANNLSYMSDSSIQKAERDPLYLLQERQRLKDASDKKMMQEFMSPYEYDVTADVPYRKESKIDPNDWRSSVAKNTDGTYNEFIYTGEGKLGGYYQPMKGVNKYKDNTLKDALGKQEFLQESNIDQGLMNPVYSSVQKKYASSYAQNYGVNREWTDQFDKEVLQEYRKQEASFSRVQPQSIQIQNPEARKDMLNTIAGWLNSPENVMVIPAGSETPVSANSVGLSRSSIMDDKTGKLKGDALKYVLPGAGNSGAGYQIYTDKGVFTVVDQHMGRNAYGREMSGALNPLFFKGEGTSPTTLRIPLYDERGQAHVEHAFIEKKIVRKEDGTYGEFLFAVPSIDNGQGQRVPDYARKQLTSLSRIHDAYLPEFEGALGSGQTDSNRFLYTFLNSFKD